MIKAARLVEEKMYNEAILILTNIIRDDPERMDEVEVLLKEIRRAREVYNEKYSDLIEAYGDDLEKAYTIIKELEELDKNPNKATANSLVLARETAGFVYNNNRWKQIMDDAIVLLDQNKYWEAVSLYFSGFDLSRDIYNDMDYGNIIETSIENSVFQADSFVQRFLDTENLVQELQKQEESAFAESSPELFIDGVMPLYTELLRISVMQKTLDDIAIFLAQQNLNIQKQRSEEKEIHYLVYLNKLILGRSTADRKEGIKGAIELLREDIIEKLENHSMEKLNNTFTEADTLFYKKNYDQATLKFQEAILYSNVAVKALSLWESSIYVSDELSINKEGKQIINEKVPSLVFIQGIKFAAETYVKLISEIKKIDEIDTAIPDTEVFSELVNYRADLLKKKENISMYLKDWNVRVVHYNDLLSLEYPIDSSIKTADDMILILESNIGETEDIEIKLISRIGELEYIPLIASFEEQESNVNAGKTLLSGTTKVIGEGDNAQEIMVIYPKESREKFLESQKILIETGDKLKSILNTFREESSGLVKGEGLKNTIDRGEILQAEMDNLNMSISELIKKSGELVFLAERYRQEGEQRIEEAKYLMKKNEFTGAKERLETAAIKIDESLKYQEDSILRDLRDKGIPEIYDELIDAENTFVITQVRNFINKGKEFYSQGQFADAQIVLISAQSRWADTHVEKNQEVEYWLTLVQTALSVNSGREISITDPLYAEMNQYLNQANKNIQEGEMYLEAGENLRADMAFDKAKKNILNVQQYFPFNRDARVLKLRITQLTDQDNFNEIFRIDFLKAKDKIKVNSREAYIDLKDLEVIKPDYPGMAKAIEEAEYAAGIKVRPPDRTGIDKSNKFYNDAYQIVQRNIKSEFSIAIAYLDESISLNPQNTKAIQLKDYLSTDTGGTATRVLSNADQQKYQEAVDEFTAGNYLKAKIIIDILLKNPDNRNNSRLLELKERIESAG